MNLYTRPSSIGIRPRKIAGSILFMLAGALIGACADRSGEPTEAHAGPYALTATLSPDPPKQRGGDLRLGVRDPEGATVSEADVSVRYFMPAMGAMAEMRGDLSVTERADGQYVARLDLPMGGSWRLDVAVDGPSGRGTAAFDMTTGSRGLYVEYGAGGPSPARDEPARDQSLALAPKPYPTPAFEALATAFDAYERGRAALAGDRLEDVAPAAERAQRAVATTASGVEVREKASAVLAEAERAARSLAAADDLEAARAAFGELTRMLLAAASADPRLQEGKTVWSCPMTDTFPKWIQPAGDVMENPYMGQEMPSCGAESDWTVTAPVSVEEILAHADHAHTDEDGVAHYTCSMHPSVREADPGTCPICSMNLVPVTQRELATGIARVDPARRQAIGVRTEAVTRRQLTADVRAVGTVVYDETRLADVTLKIAGWIGRLQADRPGQLVRRGETLFTLYSPEAYAAQQEFLTAVNSQRAAAGTGAPQRADYLVRAARERLRLWDLSAAQIDQLAATGEPLEQLPVLSPVTGHVVEKNVVAGAAVEPGQTLFRIAALDRVWVEADVYESELPLIEVGQQADVTLPYLPGETFTGQVAFVYPWLDEPTRTGRARIELPNADLRLKPDMFANVHLRRNLGERLVVPEEAVLHAGDRRFVFVDRGEGRLEPVQIQTGITTPDWMEVLSGVEPGDQIVTSGNFLVAAESRLKLALDQWK